MSIRKMIGLHPDVNGHTNQPLSDAVHHLMYCAKMCLSCADACAAEKMDMRQCIRTCLDCADVCQATGTLASRRTGSNAQLLAGMLQLCEDACRICAQACMRHAQDMAHCRICADACRECETACRDASAAMGPTLQ